MAYIEPSTVIRICNNVPMDSSYRHTILFDSETEQINYFVNKSKFPLLQRNTYQRVTKNKMRIQLKADDLYDCNYMCFQNTNFGTKWFYAFIINVEYVNNETSEITYQIDEMQTWLFNMEIKQCYVEREHVNSDKVGDNTVNENLELGEYVITNVDKATYGSGIMMQILTDDMEEMGEIVNGVYSGIESYCYNTDDIETVRHIISAMAQYSPDRIANIQMCTNVMCPTDGGTPIQGNDEKTLTLDLIFRIVNREHPVTDTESGDTYLPQNNKLYTYPYCFFTCDNYSGNAQIYRYEDFYDYMHPKFRIHHTPLPVPIITASPYNYKYWFPSTPLESDKFSTLYAVQYDEFPKCAWTNDSYALWLSTNQPKMQLNTGLNIANSVINIAKYAAIGTVGGGALGAYSMMNIINEVQDTTINTIRDVGNYQIDREYHELHSASQGGRFCSGLNFDLGNIGFRFTQYAVRPEYARRIDEFFTMFGYKIDKSKIPNIRGRKYFNYVKCYNSLITGDVPSNSREVIENIFNRGVTFWHTTDVGNYNVINSII